jgi:hypothetical protein
MPPRPISRASSTSSFATSEGSGMASELSPAERAERRAKVRAEARAQRHARAQRLHSTQAERHQARAQQQQLKQQQKEARERQQQQQQQVIAQQLLMLQQPNLQPHQQAYVAQLMQQGGGLAPPLSSSSSPSLSPAEHRTAAHAAALGSPLPAVPLPSVAPPHAASERSLVGMGAGAEAGEAPPAVTGSGAAHLLQPPAATPGATHRPAPADAYACPAASYPAPPAALAATPPPAPAEAPPVAAEGLSEEEQLALALSLSEQPDLPPSPSISLSEQPHDAPPALDEAPIAPIAQRAAAAPTLPGYGAVTATSRDDGPPSPLTVVEAGGSHNEALSEDEQLALALSLSINGEASPAGGAHAAAGRAPPPPSADSHWVHVEQPEAPPTATGERAADGAPGGLQVRVVRAEQVGGAERSPYVVYVLQVVTLGGGWGDRDGIDEQALAPQGARASHLDAPEWAAALGVDGVGRHRGAAARRARAQPVSHRRPVPRVGRGRQRRDRRRRAPPRPRRSRPPRECRGVPPPLSLA